MEEEEEEEEEVWVTSAFSGVQGMLHMQKSPSLFLFPEAERTAGTKARILETVCWRGRVGEDR